VLHPGGPDAGVVTSIETARLAIDGIAGNPPPATMTRPLPSALIARVLAHHRGPSHSALVGKLRPLPMTRWNRTAIPATSAIVRAGASDASSVDHLTSAALSSEPVVADIMALCDGTRTVEDVVATLSTQRRVSPPRVLSVLVALWKTNGLTWLPPG
jgi:hypothetical protein